MQLTKIRVFCWCIPLLIAPRWLTGLASHNLGSTNPWMLGDPSAAGCGGKLHYPSQPWLISCSYFATATPLFYQGGT